MNKEQIKIMMKNVAAAGPRFTITTFDINGKAIAETPRGTKAGLDLVLETVVRDMNDIWTDVDTFTVIEKDAV